MYNEKVHAIKNYLPTCRKYKKNNIIDQVETVGANMARSRSTF